MAQPAERSACGRHGGPRCLSLPTALRAAPLLRSAAALACGVSVALLLGCAAKPTYWTRGEASLEEFRKESRRCNEKAQIQAFEEARDGGGDCSIGTGGAGCRGGGSRPQTPFPEQTEKNRLERRRAYLYGQCLETRGWVKNYEERGYKGR